MPVGTIVWREGEVIADLSTAGQSEAVAFGGDGGFGNAHFKSSVRQAPRIAEKGEIGDNFEADLELKLLADVGLIGFPNAGKSTLLSVISNARPEIADYAFTTLTPKLGVADIDGTSLLVADIPGLIEGASKGKGLGHKFLRHVERTAVLIHLIDAYSSDIARDYQIIRTELANYSADLASRPEIVALSKTEGLDDELINLQLTELGKVIDVNVPVFKISAVAHQGLDDLLREAKQQVDLARAQAPQDETEPDSVGLPVIRLDSRQLSEAWVVEKLPTGNYQVSGEKIERFARRTDFDNPEGVNRLRDIMGKVGITHELRRRGAEASSIIEIAGQQLTLAESSLEA